MPFVQTVMPQFRDADADGLVGLRGCMRVCQDIHTWYMHALEKGNDTLPERYGAAWIYTRYQIRLHRKLDYSGPAELAAWIEPGRQAVRAMIDVTIRQNGAMAAQARMESCIYSLTERRPLRLRAVEFPEDLGEDLPRTIPEFRKPEKQTESMELRYLRTVRVCDLDKSRHMTNLRYIEMFEDAYDSAFWAAFQPKEMAVSFLSQCMEGETLSILARREETAVHLAALHADGTPASLAVFAK